MIANSLNCKLDQVLTFFLSSLTNKVVMFTIRNKQGDKPIMVKWIVTNAPNSPCKSKSIHGYYEYNLVCAIHHKLTIADS